MATPVDPADPGKKTSDIVGPMSDEATVQMELQDEKCYWNDQAFSQGDQVESAGTCYECSFGRWVEIED